MKSVYRALAILISVLVLVQAAGIAMGTFGILNFIDDGTDYTKTIAENGDATGAVGQMVHSIGAIAILLVAIILLVVSFFAKISGGVKWAGYIFLDVVVQWVLAIVAFGVPAIGALHGINAFVMFGLGMMAAQNVRKSSVSTEEQPAEQPA
jgi:hypothetical protein